MKNSFSGNIETNQEDLSGLKNYELYKKLVATFSNETKKVLKETKNVDKDRKKFDRFLPFFASLITWDEQKITKTFIEVMLSFSDSEAWEDELMWYFSGGRFHFDSYGILYYKYPIIKETLESLADIEEDFFSHLNWLESWQQFRKILESCQKYDNPFEEFKKMVTEEYRNSKNS